MGILTVFNMCRPTMSIFDGSNRRNDQICHFRTAQTVETSLLILFSLGIKMAECGMCEM